MFYRIKIPFFLALVQTAAMLEIESFVSELCIETRDRSAYLNCSRGFISNVTVESGTGDCKKKDLGKCLGKTPSLMVDYMNCYWQHECKISWPRDLIIFTESVGNGCIGRMPTFMAISYKCFHPTDFQEDHRISTTSESGVHPKTLLIDVCSKLGDSNESCYERTGPANIGGIIRSHRLYPWDYSYKPRNCSVKLYWPKQQELVLTVKNVDLSDDDSVVIVNKNKTINATSDKTFRFSAGFETSFVFRVGMESNSGKGFLLCFKFVPENDVRVQDACKEIMEDGDVKAVPDDDAPPQLAELVPDTLKSEPTTSKPENTTQKIPARCLKKKPGKKRDRCIKRRQNRKRNPKRKNGRGKKNRKDKRSKKKTRRRRHGVRKHNRRRSW